MSTTSDGNTSIYHKHMGVLNGTQAAQAATQVRAIDALRGTHLGLQAMVREGEIGDKRFIEALGFAFGKLMTAAQARIAEGAAGDVAGLREVVNEAKAAHAILKDSGAEKEAKRAEAAAKLQTAQEKLAKLQANLDRLSA